MMPRGLVKVVFLAAFAPWCAASVYVVRPSELGVVQRFGAPRAGLLRPGLHFCPRGIDRVTRVEATRAFTMSIGFEIGDPLGGVGEDDLWLTGDANILAARLVAQYQVSDPMLYLLKTRDAGEVLRRATETAITESLAATAVDDVLTTGRAKLLESVRIRAQALLDGYGVGVYILSLALRSAEPPSLVIGAFKDVQDARSDREKLINQARGYANETVPKARGDAETLTAAAAGERGRRVEAARGDAGRFEAVRAGASRAPADFRKRTYLEAAERLVPRMRLYVIEAGGGGTRLRLIQPAPGKSAPAERPGPEAGGR
jgi:membrane protease subunit HflK